MRARALIAAGLLLALSACGSGDDRRLTVEAEAGDGGQVWPASQQVAPEQPANLTVSAEPGYELDTISGCGGHLSGSTYITAPVTGDCTVSARFRLSEFEVSTSTDGNGRIAPSFATLTIEDSARFTLIPDEDFRLLEITGCGGQLEGDTYTVEALQSDCTIDVHFEPDVYRVSGEISAAAFTTFDATLNDATLGTLFGQGAREGNQQFDTGQIVNNRATLSGFASAVPTDVACDVNLPERFRDTPNPEDYYRVNLQAGQLLQLQIVNHNGHNGLCEQPDNPEPARPAGDLDLYLFSYNDQNEHLASSIGEGEFEEIVVPESGDYILNVRAESGLSKYVLRLLPEGTPPLTSLEQTIGGDFVPGEMIVKNKPRDPQDAGASSALYLESIAPARTRATPGPAHRALDVLRQRNPRAFEKMQTIDAIKARRKDPAVAYAEPNYRRRALLEPNDPGFFRQWHYDLINLPRAWDISTGEPSSGLPAPIVAVLDTGVVLHHPDLQNQLIAGYDFVDDDSDPSDPGEGDGVSPPSWHGTHVAGTVAADSDNGVGGAGVAWGARIMPVRVLGASGGTSFDVIQGVRFAAGLNDSAPMAERPADIINLSLGGTGFSQSEAGVYAEARERGVLLVASAGNENNTAPFYPAAYAGVLSVAATNALGQRAPYSNFGESLALAAPGGYLREDANGDGLRDGIFSTVAQRDGDTIQPAYTDYQGTSMAAPHVSGVLALMKAVHPDLTPSDVEQMLAAGLLTGSDQKSEELGYGQIDAELAVASAHQLATGELPDLPPRLVLTPSRLNLGNTEQALVQVTNEGGSEPDSISVSTDSAWLGIEPIDTDNGLGSYRVSVERTGLSDGFYQGEVIFLVDSQREVSLPVFMQKGELSTEGELTLLYVLLIDPDTDEVVEQTLALPDETGRTSRFEFGAVSPGQYILLAGSDVDADGFICQQGEQCGGYPNLEREQPIEIGQSDRSDLDFVASILGGFVDSTAEGEGSNTADGPDYARPISPPPKGEAPGSAPRQ